MPVTDVGTSSEASPQEGRGGCYRVQVLVVGQQKTWRDAVSAQTRTMGFQPTACDRGTDAMKVLALGLPVDVMVIDAALPGSMCCTSLAVEARVLRPSLRIILSGEATERTAAVPDVLTMRSGRLRDGLVASTVRAALASRAA